MMDSAQPTRRNAYITLLRQASDEFTVQRSRFIGHARPCTSEEEALAFLKAVREEYRDASHNCYAYVIGENQGIMRYSDDGEPGGTAGLPMMDVLRSRQVVNASVVVTRYFGGILLGTGGLVRAYTQGCKIALEAAGIVTMEWTCRDLCEVPYSCWDSIQYALERQPARAENVEYGAAVTFTLLTREKDRESVLDALRKASSRQLETLPEEEKYEAWESRR